MLKMISTCSRGRYLMVAHAVWKPASLVYDSLSSHWAGVGLGWIGSWFDLWPLWWRSRRIRSHTGHIDDHFGGYWCLRLALILGQQLCQLYWVILQLMALEHGNLMMALEHCFSKSIRCQHGMTIPHHPVTISHTTYGDPEKIHPPDVFYREIPPKWPPPPKSPKFPKMDRLKTWWF